MAVPELDALKTQVESNKTVIDSAVVLIQGVAARIDKAVADAMAAGATPEVLASLTDLSANLKSEDDALAAAVAANTPVAPAAAKPAKK